MNTKRETLEVTDVSRFILQISISLGIIKLLSRRASWVNDLGLHNQMQLSSILANEQARADRNGHEFSVIVFHVDSTRKELKSLKILARIITQRLRSVDEVGWIVDAGS